MQAITTNGAGSTDGTAIVWIEDGAGAIARGLADSVTASGAHARISGRPAIAAGEEVALRLCFEPGTPTVALAARVAWVRSVDDAMECGLEWTGTAKPQDGVPS